MRKSFLWISEFFFAQNGLILPHVCKFAKMQNAKCKTARFCLSRLTVFCAFAKFVDALFPGKVDILQPYLIFCCLVCHLAAEVFRRYAECCFTPRVAWAHATCSFRSRDASLWAMRRMAVFSPCVALSLAACLRIFCGCRCNILSVFLACLVLFHYLCIVLQQKT